jgi:hypothetical protein
MRPELEDLSRNDADQMLWNVYVCLAFNSGHRPNRSACRRSATTGLMRRSNRILLHTGKTAGAGPADRAGTRCRRPFLVRRGDGRPQLLSKKRGRSLNQPVGCNDANDIGEDHVQPVK